VGCLPLLSLTRGGEVKVEVKVEAKDEGEAKDEAKAREFIFTVFLM
jgi:hypothetical protein